jgi:high affinity sulfate transporter 1
MAGCETAASNIVMSCVVLLTLELITPLFKYTPNAVLASIIIAAVVGLVDIKAVILLWKIDKFDFLACMGAFFGVVFKSVEIGLLIAVRIEGMMFGVSYVLICSLQILTLFKSYIYILQVAISFAKILLQVTRPRTAVLGKLPGTHVYRNVDQYPKATTVSGILIVRVDSAIYFSNCNYIKERYFDSLSLS